MYSMDTTKQGELTGAFACFALAALIYLAATDTPPSQASPRPELQAISDAMWAARTH